MKYQNITEGEFVDRPNRFIAHVRIGETVETVHVKNTGRCKELLVPGARVFLEKSANPARRTSYDLVAVEKNHMLINMDSQAPNKAAEEWLLQKELFPDLVKLRPETVYGNSRFDFYIETEKQKIFLEVKGVTLEDKGVVSFPDAPSERAIKHVQELVEAKRAGYEVYVLFVVQMEKAEYFTPNAITHPEFAQSLEEAAKEGVQVLAYTCKVTEDSMTIDRPLPVRFGKNLPVLKTSLRIGALGEIPKPLLKWYDKNRRILPWREEPTPYRVWVSEIMLQQTRVEAVKPYFERFMKALPDIQALAEAEEETLLKLWEGLGYYNRVRNLQKAAIQIMEDYGGQMPLDYEELLKLKGIGSYTAGAVSSIAGGRAVPAVDGNVLRVVSRVREDERLITDAKVKAAVEEDLKKVMPTDRPGDFNQAMMEIGACVCIPNGAPHCEECPLSEICKAHLHDSAMEFPKKASKKERKIEEKTILILMDENRAALHKRKNSGLLAGMYEFPSMEGFHTAEEVAAYLNRNGIKPLRITPLEEAKHIFTHKEWHMQGFFVRTDELSPKNPGKDAKDWVYVAPEETKDKYPIPSAFAAYARYLGMHRGI